MTEPTHDAVMAIVRAEAKRWSTLLDRFANPLCDDGACPSCNERRRRKVEEA